MHMQQPAAAPQLQLPQAKTYTERNIYSARAMQYMYTWTLPARIRTHACQWSSTSERDIDRYHMRMRVHAGVQHRLNILIYMYILIMMMSSSST